MPENEALKDRYEFVNLVSDKNDWITVLVCLKCGAVAPTPAVHDSWHAQEKARIEVAVREYFAEQAKKGPQLIVGEGKPVYSGEELPKTLVVNNYFWPFEGWKGEESHERPAES